MIRNLDFATGVGRYMNVVGRGYMLGIPERAADCSLTTGVPTNSVAGWGKGAIWLNFLGSVGSLFYVNTGSATSSTWTNIL